MNRKIVVITLLSILFIYIIFCFYGYPLLLGDTECFLPVAFKIRLHQQLINPFYNAGFIKGNKFLFYPPFYPFFMSFFIIEAKAIYAYVGLTIVNLSTIFVVSLIVQHLIKINSINRASPTIDRCFLVFFFIAICTFVSPGNSRPEVLCYLILSLTIYLFLKPVKYRFFLIGILGSLGVLTSPVFGIYLSFLILLYIFYRFPNSYKVFASLFLGALCVLFFFLVTYPYPVAEMVKTMQIHFSNVIVNRDEVFSFGSFFQHYFFSGNAAFIGLVFAVALIIVVKRTFTDNKSIKGKYFISLLLVLLVISIVYFGFRNFAMSYYLTVLAPLMLIIIFQEYISQTDKGIKLFLLSTVILASTSMLRLTVNFGLTFLSSKFDIGSVEKKLSHYTEDQGKTVGISPSFWIFFSGQVLCKPVIYYKGNSPKNYDYIILQQVGTGIYSPPRLEGYDLIENYFENKELRVLGIKTASYSPFYQYAAYKKHEKNSLF
ncbi:MAG: hypothetical protein WKF91_05110 [Segetibacter sp.]